MDRDRHHGAVVRTRGRGERDNAGTGRDRPLAEERALELLVLLALGRIVAHLATLRTMSLAVAGMLQAGQNPNLQAALVKDLGTNFEQEIPEIVHSLLEIEPTATGTDLEQTMAYIVQRAPSFSLRGGTREILRGIIARGLGLR